MINNAPSSFKVMISRSNELIINAINKYIDIKELYIEEDPFSPNDLLIKLPNNKFFMIEGKVRNASYSSYMMEHLKIVNLRKKELYYKEEKNILINDILYVNVVNEELNIFSMNELRRAAENKELTYIDEVMSQTKINKFFEDTNSKYLYTKIRAKEHTATNGSANYVIKPSVLFNTQFAIPNQTLQNYEFN